MPRTEDAEAQRAEKDQQKADAAEAERIGNARADDREHVHFIFVGDAEVTAQRILQPFFILLKNRPVEAEAMFGLRALGNAHFFHAVAVVGTQRVAGGKARNDERQQREQQDAYGEAQQRAQQSKGQTS